MNDPENRLIAYELHQAAEMPIRSTEVDRAWRWRERIIVELEKLGLRIKRVGG